MHEGSGTLETTFGDVPYKDGDYVVIPRGTTYRFMPEGAQRYLVFETPGLIEIPRRYRNQYGQILEGAPYYHRDIHPPDRAARRIASAATSSSRCASAAATRTTSSTTTPSTSSAGTATSTRGRSRSTTSSRSRAASTSRRRRTRRSRGRTSSSARSARASSTSTRTSVPIPYHHSNLQSEEMIYYVSGNFGSRKGISVGSITLHPSGLPHGPQPGLAEKSLGVTRDHRARGHVRHVPAAQALDASPATSTTGATPTRGTSRRRRSPSLAGVTSHL